MQRHYPTQWLVHPERGVEVVLESPGQCSISSSLHHLCLSSASYLLFFKLQIQSSLLICPMSTRTETKLYGEGTIILYDINTSAAPNYLVIKIEQCLKSHYILIVHPTYLSYDIMLSLVHVLSIV